MSFAPATATQASTFAAASAVLNCDAAVNQSLANITGGIISNAGSDGGSFGVSAEPIVIKMSSAPSQAVSGLWRSIADSVGNGAKASNSAMMPRGKPVEGMYDNPGYRSSALFVGASSLTLITVILSFIAIRAFLANSAQRKTDFASEEERATETPATVPANPFAIRGASLSAGATEPPVMAPTVSDVKETSPSGESKPSPLSSVGVSGHKTGATDWPSPMEESSKKATKKEPWSIT